MKKVWNMPTMEVLDINQTMGGTVSPSSDGSAYDMNDNLIGPSTGGCTLYSKWKWVPR